MGNSSRRPEEEEIKLNSSSQPRETEQEYQQRILKFIRDNVIQQRTVNGKEDANSFGEIEFERFDKFENKRAPYVRVADDTNIEILWKLMIKEWEIPEPKMIISLTGGAQHFVGWNEDRLKILFNQGLVKAAINTDAWIITGGSAAGLMQKLGKAITEERQLEEEKGKKVVALGIADWNTTKNNDLLTNSSNEGLWPAKYHEHDREPKRDGDGFTPALDCNHTHFILVDGARGSYSPDITLRAKFERYIQRHGGTELGYVDAKSPGEETTVTPVVLMVVEGGYGTIEIVHQSLGQKNADGESHTVDGIPVVIVGGSGRAADIIAKALRQKDKIEPNDSLKKDIRDILGGNENQVDDCVKLLEEIRRHRNSKLVTVFEMDDANLDNIDEAILRAVLTMPALSGKVQLDLAVELNKSDIARDEILKPDKLSYWKGKLDFLQRNVFWTLRDNKADFVELLLTYLVDMDTFVTKKWLEELYYAVIYGEINDADRIISTRHILQEKFEDDQGRVKFKDVNCLFLKLTNGEYGKLDKEDEHDELDKEDECGEPDKEKFDPDKQLFLWAVLLNRRALAILFWKRLATGNVGAALIASRILGALAVYAEKIKDLRLQSSLKKHAKEFEDLAIHLLERCYEANAKMSKMILVRTLPAWGETTCLSIAYSAKLMNFMKCDCCQRKVYDVWMGNLSIYSWKQWLKFFVGIILPIFPLMSFRGMKSKEDSSSETKSFVNYFLRCGYSSRDTEFGVRRSGFGKKDVTFWEGMRYFYTAPITKFVYSLVSYLILLVLYAIFLLTDLRPSEEEDAPSIIELIVISWVCTLVVEEVRQLLVREPKSTIKKAFSWYSDVWNRFDLLMYVLFAVSVTLRLALPPCRFADARVMYSLTFILFSVRLLPLGFVSEGVGPKIIMIIRMMKDLCLFLYILMIFIVSFGIANEAILNPNGDLSSNLIFRSVYKPYWRLYGELLLEDDEELAENATLSQDPRLMNVCPEVGGHQWVAPTLTAIYMLISNILLVNLLIAMFSYTFQSVQDNAELYWKFYRFGLISEYHDRPTLAPPLIIFNHVYRFIIYLRQKKRVSDKKIKESSSLRVELAECYDEALNLFEKKHLQNYLIKKNQQQIDTTDKRVDKVINEIGECKSGSQSRLEKVEEGLLKMEKTVEERLFKVEKTMEERFLKVEKTIDNMEKNVGEMLKIIKQK